MGRFRGARLFAPGTSDHPNKLKRPRPNERANDSTGGLNDQFHHDFAGLREGFVGLVLGPTAPTRPKRRDRGRGVHRASPEPSNEFTAAEADFRQLLNLKNGTAGLGT